MLETLVICTLYSMYCIVYCIAFVCLTESHETVPLNDMNNRRPYHPAATGTAGADLSDRVQEYSYPYPICTGTGS